MKTETEIRQAIDDIISAVSAQMLELPQEVVMTAYASLSALAWAVGWAPLSQAFDNLLDGLRGEQVQRELDT